MFYEVVNRCGNVFEDLRRPDFSVYPDIDLIIGVGFPSTGTRMRRIKVDEGLDAVEIVVCTCGE